MLIIRLVVPAAAVSKVSISRCRLLLVRMLAKKVIRRVPRIDGAETLSPPGGLKMCPTALQAVKQCLFLVG